MLDFRGVLWRLGFGVLVISGWFRFVDGLWVWLLCCVVGLGTRVVVWCFGVVFDCGLMVLLFTVCYDIGLGGLWGGLVCGRSGLLLYVFCG